MRGLLLFLIMISTGPALGGDRCLKVFLTVDTVIFARNLVDYVPNWMRGVSRSIRARIHPHSEDPVDLAISRAWKLPLTTLVDVLNKHVEILKVVFKSGDLSNRYFNPDIDYVSGRWENLLKSRLSKEFDFIARYGRVHHIENLINFAAIELDIDVAEESTERLRHYIYELTEETILSILKTNRNNSQLFRYFDKFEEVRESLRSDFPFCFTYLTQILENRETELDQSLKIRWGYW